jgi:hypothetical protein
MIGYTNFITENVTLTSNLLVSPQVIHIHLGGLCDRSACILCRGDFIAILESMLGFFAGYLLRLNAFNSVSIKANYLPSVEQKGGLRDCNTCGQVRSTALVSHRLQSARQNRQAVSRTLVQSARSKHQHFALDGVRGLCSDFCTPRGIPIILPFPSSAVHYHPPLLFPCHLWRRTPSFLLNHFVSTPSFR